MVIYDERYVSSYDPDGPLRMRRLRRYMQLRSDYRVVDFGCGNGLLLAEIGRSVQEYVGVDSSQAFVDDALRRLEKSKCLNASFFCQEFSEFSQGHEACFDRAFLLDVSEHVHDEDLLPALWQIRATLKREGILYLHSPNRSYFLERLKARGILRQVEGHVAVRTAAEMERLLRRAGFGDVRTRFIPHYLYPARAFHFASRLPLLGGAFQARLFISAGANR